MFALIIPYFVFCFFNRATLKFIASRTSLGVIPFAPCCSLLLMKIAVIGLGYVGFPLACAIAHNKSYEVCGFDLSEQKIELIKDRKSPVEDERAKEDIKTVNINASSEPDVIKDSEIFLICVPTPVHKDYMPDLDPIEKAVKMVAQYLKKGTVVVIESTVNPGVCEEIVVPILEKETGMKAGEDFDVAHCPERINPGDTKWNVYNIPRNIGATSPKACKKIADFYRSFLEGEINEMSSLKVAEATKIVENTFRDINIAYVNELAKSFDVLGIDLIEVIKGASNKPFAFMPHFPSCGVGGHCIPVDPYYLIERAKKSGFKHTFLSTAREVNNSMPIYTVKLLTEALNEVEKSVKGTKIGILGVSYKSNVGDTRESPSVRMIKMLKDKGADLEIYDPYLPQESTKGSTDDLLSDAEAVLIATDHDEFKKLELQDFTKNGIQVLIDGKNIFNKTSFSHPDLIYKGIGRG